MAGSASLDSIRYRADSFYKDRNIRLIRGVRVNSIDPAGRVVSCGDQGEFSYDRLLLATGSRPVTLDIDGAGLKGVFVLRSYDQAVTIARHAAGVKEAVVIGGGLIGLKAAYALRQRGLPVTVVVKSKHILSRPLNDYSAGLVEAELREAGINFIFGQNPKHLPWTRRKSIKSVVLEDGQELPAGLALVAKGVIPNAGLAREAGGDTAGV